MAFIKDEEKQLLLDRYLDIEWPDDVDDLRCVRCDRVAIFHYVSNCKHNFCKNCRKVFSDGGHWKCPRCQEYVTQLDDQDFDIEIKTLQLKIFCPNKKYGCKYEDQLRKIPSHLMTCVDTREAALPAEYTGANTMDAVVSNLTKVNADIGELKEEIREVKDEVENKFKLLEDKDDFQSKPKIKEWMSSVNSKVEIVELRLNEYTEEIQSIKSLLESMDQRIQNNELLIQQMMEKMSSNSDEIKFKLDKTTKHNEEANESKKSEELIPLTTQTYKWTIKNEKKRLLKDNWIYESDPFIFSGCKYEIKAKLENVEGKLHIRLQFKDGDTLNKSLDKYGFTAVTYIIRDRMNIQNKKDIIQDTFLQFHECSHQNNWIFGRGISKAMLTQPYMKNDDIKATVLFDPPSIDRSFVSNNGILMWTVDNYTTRKQEQLYRDIWSPSFYTSPRGYRVKTRLILYNSKPMLVEIYFLTGEHDGSLSNDFPHKTTVTLFNQVDPLKNLVKNEQRDDLKFHTIQLESCSLIEDKGFVKDDSLLIKVMIEPVQSK